MIKDSMFDISTLKSKRRYEVNKGNKNFEVHVIDPTEYVNELFCIQKQAWDAYPKKYRPKLNKESFLNNVLNQWKKKPVYGAFDKKDGKLCGYAVMEIEKSYAEFSVLKSIPECEKKGINAAIIYKIICDFNPYYNSGYYICDGERNISHEMAFQDYLEKYFGFRKAYCRLHVKYRPSIKIAVYILYPFRKILKIFDRNALLHNAISILFMEQLRRTF